MTDKMDYRALRIASNYIVDVSEPGAAFDVFIVWKAKILQNWKYMISSSLSDAMYFELTYNGNKKEWYLDVYKKVENKVIKDGAL